MGISWEFLGRIDTMIRITVCPVRGKLVVEKYKTTQSSSVGAYCNVSTVRPYMALFLRYGLFLQTGITPGAYCLSSERAKYNSVGQRPVLIYIALSEQIKKEKYAK